MDLKSVKHCAKDYRESTPELSIWIVTSRMGKSKVAKAIASKTATAIVMVCRREGLTLSSNYFARFCRTCGGGDGSNAIQFFG